MRSGVMPPDLTLTNRLGCRQPRIPSPHAPRGGGLGRSVRHKVGNELTPVSRVNQPNGGDGPPISPGAAVDDQARNTSVDTQQLCLGRTRRFGHDLVLGLGPRDAAQQPRTRGLRRKRYLGHLGNGRQTDQPIFELHRHAIGVVAACDIYEGIARLRRCPDTGGVPPKSLTM